MGAVLTPLEHDLLLSEGFRSTPYKDSLGNTTIGIGFKEGPAVGSNRMTEEQALQMLRSYYLPQARDAARNYVGKDFFDKMDSTRQAVLIDMAYNMGATRLGKFQRAREAILKQDWSKASKEILRSRYAKQVPARARRNALRMQQGFLEAL